MGLNLLVSTCNRTCVTMVSFTRPLALLLNKMGVERKHWHLLAIARSLRFQANLPLRFLGRTCSYSCLLINYTPNSILSEKTPYEMFNKLLSYGHLRVFGRLCFAHNHPISRTNLMRVHQDASSLATHMVRKDGVCMIFLLVTVFPLPMLYFMKTNFHLLSLTLHLPI